MFKESTKKENCTLEERSGSRTLGVTRVKGKGKHSKNMRILLKKKNQYVISVMILHRLNYKICEH